jgi:methionyl aminopeptidase
MTRHSRNDLCWCGSGKKYKKCHLRLDALKPPEPETKLAITLKNEEQLEGIRRSCRLAVAAMDMVAERISASITTGQINDWVHEYLLSHNAYPAPLNYHGFPRSICTSVNEVVCHGIPGDQVLREGDIVNVDITTILEGYFGDLSRMFIIGQTSAEAERLVRVTRECLFIGIAQVRPGGRLGDLGAAIQRHAEQHGYSVVRNIGGHGVGLQFHEEPFVPHYGRRGTGVLFRPNMTFTVEPMINAGVADTEVLDDEWTVITADEHLSAQWEHTVRVTPTGVEILTLGENETPPELP